MKKRDGGRLSAAERSIDPLVDLHFLFAMGGVRIKHARFKIAIKSIFYNLERMFC